MKTWLLYTWERWQTSYWFIPSIMAVASALLAALTLSLDRYLQDHARNTWGLSYTGGADGARAVLATVAGSMITVAATMFSITMVTLSLASGQFGPRLLRTFIRDRRSQLVLGVFVATFTYSLLILRSIRGADYDLFIPGISVAVGIFGGLFGLAVLIYFINHVALTIQAPYVVAAVTAELCATIDRLWPDELSEKLPEKKDSQIGPFADGGSPIRSQSSGYLDAIDREGLLKIAKEHDAVIRIDVRPGHFLIEGEIIAYVFPAERNDEKLANNLNRTLAVALQRTPFQDVEFAVDQLVEVAIRALSPGINDPFTAVNCVDRLGEAMCRLVRRAAPSPLHHDDDKNLRVITTPASFSNVADAAFHQIRQYGRSSAAVMIRMLETLTAIAAQARRPDDLSALNRHGDLVRRAAQEGLPELADRGDVDERWKVLQKVLSDRGQPVTIAINEVKPKRDVVGLQSEQSFPASDPPSWTPVTGTGPVGE